MADHLTPCRKAYGILGGAWYVLYVYFILVDYRSIIGHLLFPMIDHKNPADTTPKQQIE